MDDATIWPSLLLAEWQDTHATLHMWMQIVGKTRLALARERITGGTFRCTLLGAG
jgi:hypothetical protein